MKCDYCNNEAEWVLSKPDDPLFQRRSFYCDWCLLAKAQAIRRVLKRKVEPPKEAE